MTLTVPGENVLKPLMWVQEAVCSRKRAGRKLELYALRQSYRFWKTWAPNE